MGRREASRPACRDPSLSVCSLFHRDDQRSPQGWGCRGLGTGHHTSCSEYAAPGGQHLGLLDLGGTELFPEWTRDFSPDFCSGGLCLKFWFQTPGITAPDPRPAQSSVPEHLKLVQLRVWLWTREALQELASAGQVCRREPRFCNLTCQLQGLGTWGLPLGNLQLLSENKVAPGAPALEDEHPTRARHALSQDLRGPSP